MYRAVYIDTTATLANLLAVTCVSVLYCWLSRVSILVLLRLIRRLSTVYWAFSLFDLTSLIALSLSRVGSFLVLDVCLVLKDITSRSILMIVSTTSDIVVVDILKCRDQ